MPSRPHCLEAVAQTEVMALNIVKHCVWVSDFFEQSFNLLMAFTREIILA